MLTLPPPSGVSRFIQCQIDILGLADRAHLRKHTVARGNSRCVPRQVGLLLA